MNQEQLIQQALPWIGGQVNVSRMDSRANCLHITVKDAGIVNLEVEWYHLSRVGKLTKL